MDLDFLHHEVLRNTGCYADPSGWLVEALLLVGGRACQGGPGEGVNCQCDQGVHYHVVGGAYFQVVVGEMESHTAPGACQQ